MASSSTGTPALDVTDDKESAKSNSYDNIVNKNTAIIDNNTRKFQRTPRAIVEYFYYNGWNKKNANVMKDILDLNLKFRGGLTTETMKKMSGQDGFLQYMMAAHAAMLGNNCEILDLIISSDNKKVAAKIKVTGIHKGLFFGIEGSSLEIAYNGTAFFTLNDDCTKITELWALADIDCLKNQIGAKPESTFF